LYVALEQSPDEILRNTRTIGLPLKAHVSAGLLRFHALRPTAHGLELHLTNIHQLVEEFDPKVVVVDPITSFGGMGVNLEVTSMVVRLIDYLKTRGITLFMTSLNLGGEAMDAGTANITSVVDTWLLLQNTEADGGRTRTVSILKSRGMSHSMATQIFAITRTGVTFEAAPAPRGNT
jgi:circadian clock protein KaiC